MERWLIDRLGENSFGLEIQCHVRVPVNRQQLITTVSSGDLLDLTYISRLYIFNYKFYSYIDGSFFWQFAQISFFLKNLSQKKNQEKNTKIVSFYFKIFNFNFNFFKFDTLFFCHLWISFNLNGSTIITSQQSTRVATLPKTKAESSQIEHPRDPS